MRPETVQLHKAASYVVPTTHAGFVDRFAAALAKRKKHQTNMLVLVQEKLNGHRAIFHGSDQGLYYAKSGTPLICPAKVTIELTALLREVAASFGHLGIANFVMELELVAIRNWDLYTTDDWTAVQTAMAEGWTNVLLCPFAMCGPHTELASVDRYALVQAVQKLRDGEAYNKLLDEDDPPRVRIPKLHEIDIRHVDECKLAATAVQTLLHQYTSRPALALQEWGRPIDFEGEAREVERRIEAGQSLMGMPPQAIPLVDQDTLWKYYDNIVGDGYKIDGQRIAPNASRAVLQLINEHAGEGVVVSCAYDWTRNKRWETWQKVQFRAPPEPGSVNRNIFKLKPLELVHAYFPKSDPSWAVPNYIKKPNDAQYNIRCRLRLKPDVTVDFNLYTGLSGWEQKNATLVNFDKTWKEWCRQKGLSTEKKGPGHAKADNTFEYHYEDYCKTIEKKPYRLDGLVAYHGTHTNKTYMKPAHERLKAIRTKGELMDEYTCDDTPAEETFKTDADTMREIKEAENRAKIERALEESRNSTSAVVPTRGRSIDFTGVRLKRRAPSEGAKPKGSRATTVRKLPDEWTASEERQLEGAASHKSQNDARLEENRRRKAQKVKRDATLAAEAKARAHADREREKQRNAERAEQAERARHAAAANAKRAKPKYREAKRPATPEPRPEPPKKVKMPPTSKGICFVCGKKVLSNQPRHRLRDGTYFHSSHIASEYNKFTKVTKYFTCCGAEHTPKLCAQAKTDYWIFKEDKVKDECIIGEGDPRPWHAACYDAAFEGMCMYKDCKHPQRDVFSDNCKSKLDLFGEKLTWHPDCFKTIRNDFLRQLQSGVDLQAQHKEHREKEKQQAAKTQIKENDTFQDLLGDEEYVEPMPYDVNDVLTPGEIASAMTAAAARPAVKAGPAVPEEQEEQEAMEAAFAADMEIGFVQDYHNRSFHIEKGEHKNRIKKLIKLVPKITNTDVLKEMENVALGCKEAPLAAAAQQRLAEMEEPPLGGAASDPRDPHATLDLLIAFADVSA